MKQGRPSKVRGWVSAADGATLPDTGDRLPTCAPDMPLVEAELENLESALFSDNSAVRRAAVDVMRSAGLCDSDIVDRYIPEVARRLGQDWCDDSRSFAEVAIGSSRLQAMVHDVAVDWRADIALPGPGAPAVLLVVRTDSYHTLGAIVAATRFRRLGAIVRVILEASDDDILAEARRGSYDLIAFSVSPSESLETLPPLFASLRGSGDTSPLIALGGAVIGLSENLHSLTGVDYVGSDPAEAMRLCVQRQSYPQTRALPQAQTRREKSVAAS